MANSLLLMAGLMCWLNFGLDMLAIAWSPVFSSLEWRMGLMQQLGERCLLLLFGAALVYSALRTFPLLLRSTAWFCCGLALCLILSNLFYLKDGWAFQTVAIANLTQQQQSLEQRIQQVIEQPTIDVTPTSPAQTERVFQLLGQRTDGLKLRASTRIHKTMLRTFSSLMLVTVGLLILGVGEGLKARCRKAAIN